jgi:DNA-binding transcriptional MerR regulator
MNTEKKLVTRNEVRAMGLDVSSMQFLRYEKQGLLTPRKVDGRRSSRVRYDIEEVLRLLNGRKPPPGAPALRQVA